MPAFLLQGEGVLSDKGIEHGVQIHVHQILEVLVVAAGHRVDSLIRIGNGVQKRIQGALHQFHKGFLQPVLAAATEYGMFRNMGHTGFVLGRGTETDGEDFVIILALQIQQLGPAELVGHFVSYAVYIRQQCDLRHPKAMTDCSLL